MTVWKIPQVLYPYAYARVDETAPIPNLDEEEAGLATDDNNNGTEYVYSRFYIPMLITE